jgi:hypothetical protein
MDSRKDNLIGNIAKLAIAIIGVVLTFMIIYKEDEGVIDITIKFTLAVLAACAIIALLFGLIHFVTNIGKSKGMIFGLVGFIAILGIAYSMSGSDLLDSWRSAGITEQTSKLSEMGVRAVLIMLGLTVAAAIFSEVSKVFQR